MYACVFLWVLCWWENYSWQGSLLSWWVRTHLWLPAAALVHERYYCCHRNGNIFISIYEGWFIRSYLVPDVFWVGIYTMVIIKHFLSMSTFGRQSTFGQWHRLRWGTYFWKWVFCVAATSIVIYVSVISVLTIHSWRSCSYLAETCWKLVWNSDPWKLG